MKLLSTLILMIVTICTYSQTLDKVMKDIRTEKDLLTKSTSYYYDKTKFSKDKTDLYLYMVRDERNNITLRLRIQLYSYYAGELRGFVINTDAGEKIIQPSDGEIKIKLANTTSTSTILGNALTTNSYGYGVALPYYFASYDVQVYFTSELYSVIQSIINDKHPKITYVSKKNEIKKIEETQVDGIKKVLELYNLSK